MDSIPSLLCPKLPFSCTYADRTSWRYNYFFAFGKGTVLRHERYKVKCSMAPHHPGGALGTVTSCAHSKHHKVFAIPLKASEVDEGMPAPGVVTFRRSATRTHYEFLTDLESLGLRKLSSDLSRSLAISMGLQTEKPETGGITTTPVVVSIDVNREGRDLRLDGIVRTAIALSCNRCSGPTAERVFANFSLLLTEQPVVEPTQPSLGVVLGDEKGLRLPDEGDEGEETLDLDLDDKLHFPRNQKEIDLSKYIRDTVHLEIPLQCVCSLTCLGMCLSCGVNLNTGTCTCQRKVKKTEKREIWGPLEQLKKQLEERQAE